MLLVGKTRQLRMVFVQRSVPFDCDRPLMSIPGPHANTSELCVVRRRPKKKTTPTMKLD